MSTGAGDLKDRIRFERRALDGHGDRTGDWGAEFTSRAKLTYLRGGEAVMQQRLEGRQPIAIRLRASALTRSITTAWRGVNLKTAAEYDIASASQISDEDGDWVDLLVEELSGEG